MPAGERAGPSAPALSAAGSARRNDGIGADPRADVPELPQLVERRAGSAADRGPDLRHVLAASELRVKLLVLFETRYLPHARRTLKPKTSAEYERLARKEVLPRLGCRNLDTLTLDDAEALHAAVAGAVQANRAVSLLSALLTYAVDRKLLPVNPCRGVERNPEKGREFFYSPEQTKALLAAASAWDDIRARYIALELLTGCRPGELRDSGPSWRHGDRLCTPDSKVGPRTIYLPDRACAILDGLPLLPGRDHFYGPGGRFRVHVPACYFPAGMDLRRAWVRLCWEAGVPRARLYDLRHTFASAALAAGVPIGIVGRMLGHRKDATTAKYAHLAPDIAVEAAAAAARRMGA